MAERARIARYFAPLAQAEPGSFALTDDAAALIVPPGQQLVITTDSVIAGIHVPHDAPAALIARRLMRRNLSDLAAMGAQPWRYTLNLHTPAETADAWFAEFAQTLGAEQARYGLCLVGGDSTSGAPPVHASLTCLGLSETPLRRTGAQVGDAVYVSGTVGDAALALVTDFADAALTARYDAPEPRLALGAALRGLASACIDLSDGLVADSAQLAQASRVRIVLRADWLPLSAAAQHYRTRADFWPRLCGGDDYELLFTAAPAQDAALAALSRRLGVALTRIGEVLPAEAAHPAAQLLDAHGAPIPGCDGFEHA